MLPIHDELIPWIVFKFQVRLRRDIASELQFYKLFVLHLIGSCIEALPYQGELLMCTDQQVDLCKLVPSSVLLERARSP